MILSAVAVFLLFNEFKMKSSPVINSSAKATFAVYLLNQAFLQRFADTQRYVLGSGWLMLLHIMFTCAWVCLACWCAQMLYDLLTKPIFRRIDARLKIETTYGAEDGCGR